MATISSTNTTSDYDNGGNGWAVHSGIELLTAYGRWARIPFPTLSGGRLMSSLSLTFYKTNTGGGGTFHLYASTNSGILPNQITTSAVSLGESTVFGTGTGWKTLTFNADQMNALAQFSGSFYLYMACSVYVTFSGYGGNNPYWSGTAYDGTMWENVGGVWRKANIWENVGGVWHQGLLWVNVGGVWKKGVA